MSNNPSDENITAAAAVAVWWVWRESLPKNHFKHNSDPFMPLLSKTSQGVPQKPPSVTVTLCQKINQPCFVGQVTKDYRIVLNGGFP